jgi:Domain of unknown function (DUF4062)
VRYNFRKSAYLPIAMPNTRLTIMVSSTVFGNEALLEQMYAILDGYGYRVWMSHKGTVPGVGLTKPYDACRDAARNCDIFLGILTGRYGNPKELSITHEECRIAMSTEKPVYFLAEEKIMIAGQLLKKLRNDPDIKDKLADLLQGNPIIDNIKILDLYDEARAVRSEESHNWVQAYRTPQDIHLFLTEQFGDYDAISQRIRGKI